MSVAILVILAAILILNPNQSSEEYQIFNATHLVATDMGRAQNFALSAKEFNLLVSPALPVPQGGWGLHIEKNKSAYTLFADINCNKTYDPSGGTTCDGKSVAVASEQLEQASIPQTVTVSDISVDGAGGFSLIDIVFLPPRPDVLITGSGGIPGNTAIITLKSTVLGTQKTIHINSVGHVSVQ